MHVYFCVKLLVNNLEQQLAAKGNSESELEVTDCDDGEEGCELDKSGESDGEGDTEYEDETDITTQTETEEEEIGKSNR